MNFKKWWALTAVLALCFMLVSLVLPVRASADDFYYEGYYTISNKNFPDTPYYNPFSSPVSDSVVNIPSNYVLCGYRLDVGYSSPSFPYSAYYYYCDPSLVPISFYQTGDLLSFGSSGDSFKYIENYISSNGDVSFRGTGSISGLSSGRCTQMTVFVDTVDLNGNINRPAEQVNFKLNTAILGYNLAFNSQIESGDASTVDYYIFPSSVSISGGGVTTIVNSTSTSQLSPSDEESFLDRGFDILTRGFDDLITDITSPTVSLSVSSASRRSGIFNPSSYGVSFEKIGVGRLYPSSGGGGISPTASLSLKDMISSHTGVYVNSSLKLVAVVTTANSSFVATYDFNPSQIVGGSPVPPSIIQGPVTPPNPSLNDPDLQDLADYLKNLGNTFNENQIRNDENLIAMLGAMPWSNFIGTGFASGFANALPNLSFTLDHLFDSLFDKFTAPTDDQINEILADIESERTSLRAKLAFVEDVKTEYYFVISTITADNNSVPPDFKFVLPSMWSGGRTIRCKLVTYEIATPTIMANVKSVITVFLSLALLLHIWRTLPATIGNMPRGDD